MNAITPEHEWPDYDERYALPGRPRRQLFTRASALLIAVLLGAVGFYAGVRVEKGQLSNSSSGASGRAAALLAGTGAGAGAAGSGAGAAAGGARTGGARAGFGGAGAGGGLARLLGAGAAGGAAGSFGTVSSISGHTLYLTDPSGNTIKVTLSSATKVTKSVGVSAHAVRPGDGVVIQGLRNSDGTMQATTVSDTGARAAAQGGGGAGSGSGSGGSGSASSAVGSLFGSGG
jgi:Domain of unknown function (DUF5666)